MVGERDRETKKQRQNMTHSQHTEKEAQEGRHPHTTRGEAESERQKKLEVRGKEEAANPSHCYSLTFSC